MNIGKLIASAIGETREKRTTAYGTVAAGGVVIDGSGVVTPCSNAMSAKPGDRVVVSIEDHRATITGNITAPATDDTAADKIAETFYSDDNGAHVDGAAYRSDLGSKGLAVVDKATGQVVAEFGEESRVGIAGGPRIEVGESHFAQFYRDNSDYSVVSSQPVSFSGPEATVLFSVSDGQYAHVDVVAGIGDSGLLYGADMYASERVDGVEVMRWTLLRTGKRTAGADMYVGPGSHVIVLHVPNGQNLSVTASVRSSSGDVVQGLMISGGKVSAQSVNASSFSVDGERPVLLDTLSFSPSSISASSGAYFEASVPVKSGYTCVGMVGWTTSHNFLVTLNSYEINGGKLTVSVRNLANSTQSTSATATLMYVRSELL